MAFEQATIKVEKVEEFGKLRGAVEKALSPENVEGFLKRLNRAGVRIRDFDAVLAKKVLEAAVGRGLEAGRLYQTLTMSDQAQLKEFYLLKIEKISPELRAKFHKLFQYY